MLATARRLAPRATRRSAVGASSKRYKYNNGGGERPDRLSSNVGRSLSSLDGGSGEKDNRAIVTRRCFTEEHDSKKKNLSPFASAGGLPRSLGGLDHPVSSASCFNVQARQQAKSSGPVGTHGLVGPYDVTLQKPFFKNVGVSNQNLGLRRRGSHGTAETVLLQNYGVSAGSSSQTQDHFGRDCLAAEISIQNYSQRLRSNLGSGFALEQGFARHGRGRFFRGVFPQQQQLAFFSTEPNLKQDSDEVHVEETPPDRRNWTTTTNRPRPSLKLGTTRVPTPPTPPELDSSPLSKLQKETPKSIVRKGVDLLLTAFKTVVTFMLKLPGNIVFYATHPKELREGYHRLRDIAKEEANHYWVGTKLLWADMQTARKLLGKTLEGSSLTRRERKQLLRTVSDLFRLIPFSMFVLIPFMEFALPFALRLFPNMLPSTYQDSLKAEENMKRELKSRIAMASFFQETLEEIAKEQKRKATKRKKELEEAGVDLKAEGDVTIEKQEDSAASMLEFLEKARNGEPVPPDVILRYATYFQDDLTLDNMPRMQLINMCKYMSIPPYGSDSFLRFQLRHKIRVLKEDDQRILWEGIDSLTKMELREACQERGMRSTGLSKEAYKRSLQQWLDLSVNKDLPISLLIMSRTFFLREEMLEVREDEDSKSLSGLADAISGLDKEILNEVILEVATQEEKLSDPEVRKIKLEVLTQQNELIRKEAEAREAAQKKKEAEKEKAEAKLAEMESEASPSAQPTVEPEKTISSTDTTASVETPAVEAEGKPVEEERRSEEERNLSAAEMDAISQLITDDPVHTEREELEKLKKALTKGSEESDESTGKSGEDEASDSAASDDTEKKADESDAPPVGTSPEPMWSDEADKFAQESIEKADKEAADEAEASTEMTFDDHVKKGSDAESAVADEVDPIVARLKKRVESMVDKIEVQLTETKVKIGDKLHYLDKDRDGILNKEEMAEALHQVLKRKISFEEAMEIANEMDDNKDGVFTVEELIKWIDEHKLVKFVEEDRDADMDHIIESQASSQHKEQEDPVTEDSTSKSSAKK